MDDQSPPVENPYASPTAGAMLPTPELDDAPDGRSGPSPRHFGLWAACTSVSFLFDQQVISPGRFLFSVVLETLTPLEIVFAVVSAAITGLAAACAVLMIARWVRGIPFPSQPGEWLLAGVGFAHWLNWIIYEMYVYVVPGNGYLFMQLASFAVMALQVAFLAVGGISCRSSKPWATFLIACAIAQAIVLVNRFAAFVQFEFDEYYQASRAAVMAYAIQGVVAVAIVLISLVVAIVSDYYRQQRRSWLHWAGLAWAAAFVSLAIARAIHLQLLL